MKSRFPAAALLFSLALAAQGPLVRGVLLERDPQSDSGQFAIRAADDQVFRYTFDKKTYVQRDGQMVDMAGLNPGDRLEVISDAVAGSNLRRAITIHVIPAPAAAQPQSAGRYRAQRPLTGGAAALVSSVSYSGVVVRLSPERIVLRLPDGANRPIVLRADTRYIQDGNNVDAAMLRENMRVFVRAGRTLMGDIEAVQVSWGRILQPR